MDINSNTEHFKKEIETGGAKKNFFAETKAKLKPLNSRMNNAEEWISGLDNRIKETTQLRQQTESQIKKKNESNIRNLVNNMKHANLW